MIAATPHLLSRLQARSRQWRCCPADIRPHVVCTSAVLVVVLAQSVLLCRLGSMAGAYNGHSRQVPCCLCINLVVITPINEEGLPLATQFAARCAQCTDAVLSCGRCWDWRSSSGANLLQRQMPPACRGCQPWRWARVRQAHVEPSGNPVPPPQMHRGTPSGPAGFH
jgi:hypothetical protein